MATNPAFDHSAYDAVLFIDSMIPLEGRPLPELPWSDLGLGSKLLLLVVPQVLKEVDKRKRDGRLAKRAREFRRLAEPAALEGGPVRIAEGPTIVELALAPSARINWDELHDFDPDEGDSRVVAQIINEAGVPNERKIFISQDLLPISLASKAGLTVRRFPDEWLVAPEPSPLDKEVTRLKARVRELESSEPDLRAAVTFDTPSPFEILDVEPLTGDEKRDIIQRILEGNPRKEHFRSSLMSISLGIDPDYSKNYQNYADNELPEYLSTLHKIAQDYYTRIGLRLEISNQGSVQAENMIGEVRCTGGVLYEKFRTRSLFGPAPPQRQNWARSPLGQRSLLNDFRNLRPVIVGRHDVDFDNTPEGDSTAQVHCTDFRHGRQWIWDGIAHLDQNAEQFSVEVTLTASNMKGKRTKTFALPTTSRSVRVADLVDPVARSYLISFPLLSRYEKALDNEDMDWLDFEEV